MAEQPQGQRQISRRDAIAFVVAAGSALTVLGTAGITAAKVLDERAQVREDADSLKEQYRSGITIEDPPFVPALKTERDELNVVPMIGNVGARFFGLDEERRKQILAWDVTNGGNDKMWLGKLPDSSIAVIEEGVQKGKRLLRARAVIIGFPNDDRHAVVDLVGVRSGRFGSPVVVANANEVNHINFSFADREWTARFYESEAVPFPSGLDVQTELSMDYLRDATQRTEYDTGSPERTLTTKSGGNITISGYPSRGL